MSDLAARARALIGARFRLHGRDPATGLDCIGLVAWAAEAPAPTGYALRGGDPRRIAAALEAAGFVPAAAARRPGDVLLMRPGPGQLHLGILSDGGLIHADAGLGRVVERPGAPDWEIIGTWRLCSLVPSAR
jgi:lipoprotein Spr